MIQWIRSLIFFILLMLIAVIFIPFMIIYSYCVSERRYYPIVRLWCALSLFLLRITTGVKYRVSGIENIVCLRTKEDWKNPSNLEYIRSGLISLKEIMLRNDFLTVALPPIGCGKGGLLREDVYPVIHEIMGDVLFETFIYDV